jgi:UDP-N-acetylglucosamine diphosphorylase/glucosamine-1-phosphate N-acetyltransferase
MNYLLFEDFSHFDLRPFCYTRPIFCLRSGIFTIQERWEKTLAHPAATLAYDYLKNKYASRPKTTDHLVAINGKFSPNADFLSLIKQVEKGVYYLNPLGEVLCFGVKKDFDFEYTACISSAYLDERGYQPQKTEILPLGIRKMPDIFEYNATFIQYDIEIIRKNEKSEKINDSFSAIYGKDNIFVAEGVKVRAAVLNAEDGLIYLGKGVDIQEGALIHGNHAFCDFSVANMGAKLRGDSTFGPYVKVGGEVGNSVIMGYSNKGHDGYLGNSVIGYWCNLGADTNTSNLKNTYEEVKLWNYTSERFEKTGKQFCGLMMGDHSKCGINTMFNTGTVVGVSANVFGDGFPRNFIPDFSWGGASGFSTYQLHKAFQTAKAVMERRKLELNTLEKEILQHVYELTSHFRSWEREEK